MRRPHGKNLPLLACLLLAAGSCRAAESTPSIQNIDVSGLGHAPEWQLTIDHKERRIDFTLAGTPYSYRYPLTGPVIEKGYHRTTTYHLPNDEHSLTVRIEGIACRDSETGKSYETTITVLLDSVAYKGCGDVTNR